MFVTLAGASFHYDTAFFQDDIGLSAGWEPIDPTRDTVDLSSGISYRRLSFLDPGTVTEAGQFTFVTPRAPVSCTTSQELDSLETSCAASAPFTFRGTVQRFRSEGVLSPEELVGQGTAFGSVLALSVGGDFDVIETDVSYRFEAPAPIPEPTALLLLGTGMAGAGALRLFGHPARSARARVSKAPLRIDTDQGERSRCETQSS